MFEHSVKVPRLYKIATKIAKDFQDNKGSLKQLVYEAKHSNIKALYALVAETLKKKNEIDSLLKRSKLFIKEPRFDPILARILVTELLWGKKRLAGESKPVKTILAYEQIFNAHLSNVKISSFEDNSQVQKPRYVRVNTLCISTNQAVDGFRDEEYNLIRQNDKNDYEGFLKAVSSLGESDFMVDIHMPDLLVFHPKAQFYNHPAYKNGEIILQDKASCLPVHILAPEKGSTVLDMCAAPGMKTTQIAAQLNNEGTVYAVEIDKKRMETLEHMIETTSVTCVTTINQDVLTLTNQDCPDVEYILVDPSCSGSGIVDRLEFDEKSTKSQPERLSKLAGFQIKMLRYALTRFPSAKRVVYSTCSLNVEENEDVVRQVLETCTTFKLVPARKFLNDTWLNFGSPDFGNIGKRCVYTLPEIDLANGFFVAVFERLQEGEENEFFNKDIYDKYSSNYFHKNVDNSEYGSENISNNVSKKKRIRELNEEYGSLENSNESTKRNKKKKVCHQTLLEEHKRSLQEANYFENNSFKEKFTTNSEKLTKKEKKKLKLLHHTESIEDCDVTKNQKEKNEETDISISGVHAEQQNRSFNNPETSLEYKQDNINKKNRKKKNKRVETSENKHKVYSSNCVQAENDIPIAVNKETKKKEKPKKEIINLENNEKEHYKPSKILDIGLNCQQDSIHKKKKKHRKETLTISENKQKDFSFNDTQSVSDITVYKNSKKKERHKEEIVALENHTQSENDTQIAIPRKSKKKEKYKEEVMTSENDGKHSNSSRISEPSFDCQQNSINKKKERKRNKSFETIDNELEVISPSPTHTQSENDIHVFKRSNKKQKGKKV